MLHRSFPTHVVPSPHLCRNLAAPRNTASRSSPPCLHNLALPRSPIPCRISHPGNHSTHIMPTMHSMHLHSLRAVQGNCDDPDPAAALSLGDELAQTLLPLKPRQCVVMIRETWLIAIGGALWVDNVYLRFAGRNAVSAFISAGPWLNDIDWSRPLRSDLYITRATFHGAPSTSLTGVYAGVDLVSIYIDGAHPNVCSAAAMPQSIRHMRAPVCMPPLFSSTALCARLVQWKCATGAASVQCCGSSLRQLRRLDSCYGNSNNRSRSVELPRSLRMGHANITFTFYSVSRRQDGSFVAPTHFATHLWPVKGTHLPTAAAVHVPALPAG